MDQIFIWFHSITVLCWHLNLLHWTQMSHRDFDPQLRLSCWTVLEKNFPEHTAPFKLQKPMQQTLLRLRGKAGICKGAHIVLMHLEQQQTIQGHSAHKPCQQRHRKPRCSQIRGKSQEALPELQALLQLHAATSALVMSQRPSGLLVAWRI